MHIITHRGLDAESHHTFTESSKEAFQYFLNDGFGIEFDIQITKDGIPVISHDTSLSRIAGKPLPDISNQTVDTFLGIELPHGHTLTFEEMISLLTASTDQVDGVHALHLKHYNQTEEVLHLLLPHLSVLADLPVILFDVTPLVAKHLKTYAPKLSLAASVAHPFDIERYGNSTGETLIDMSTLLQHADLYDWAWLDEWDRFDKNGNNKKLYTKETFSLLRKDGYKIAVVSPELHRTSPKLQGGEKHQDADSLEILGDRWREITQLEPDAICTDYPYRIQKLIS